MADKATLQEAAVVVTGNPHATIQDMADAIVNGGVVLHDGASEVNGIVIEKLGKYVKMWGVAKAGVVAAGGITQEQIALPVAFKDTEYAIICTGVSGLRTNANANTVDDITLAIQNETDANIDARVSWMAMGIVADE